jgi:hypothetical protein
VQEHISAKTIQQYRERQLSSAELLALDDHLVECAVCRAQISSPSALHSPPTDFIPALETEAFEHPVYEQFAAYLEGHLDNVEREIIESHLACCRQCARELSDLEVIKAEIAAYSPAITIAEPVVATSGAPRGSWRERLAAFWGVPRFRLSLQVATAAISVALITWAVTLPLRKNIAELKAQLAESQHRNEELQRDFEIAKEDAESLQTQIAQLQSSGQNPSPETRAFTLDDGPVKIDGQGNIEGLALLPAALQQTVRSAIDAGQARTPQAISSLAGKAGVLMGGGNQGVAFALTSPVGTAVSSARPTFRWQALEGATDYRVTVLDMDFNPISKSPALASTFWTVDQPLERGRAYLWTVTAIKDGKEIKSPVPPAPEARFKVLEKETANEVLQSLRAYRASHLISGLIFAQAGLLDDAEREFGLLARANPKSPAARNLLRNTKSLRAR